MVRSAAVRVDVVLLLLCVLLAAGGSHGYFEEALIRPMSGGKITYHFQFTTPWHRSNSTSSTEHFLLFPKSVGQIVSQYGIQEFHLSFTKGRWDESWGQPVVAAPPGAELYAWFDKEAADIDLYWVHTTASLSGLFCASLGSIPDLQLPRRPSSIFTPYHVNTSSDRFRYGTLPNEIVCTENITPWLKLLPCRSMEGLGALLQPLLIYSSVYHSIGTHFRPVKQSPLGSHFELVQTLTVVFSTSVAAASSYESDLKRHLNLVPSPCRTALISNIYVERENRFSSAIQLAPGSVPTRSDSKYFVFDLKDNKNAAAPQISLSWSDPGSSAVKNALQVDRYALGSGHESGTMVCTLTNLLASSSLEIRTYEAFPSLMALYLHTVKFFSGDVAIEPKNLVQDLSFAPSDLANSGKKSFSILSLRITLPPNSSISYTIEFQKNILHWTEYPPDAHRGFNVPSGVFEYRTDSTSSIDTSSPLDWSPSLHAADSSTASPRASRIYTDELLVVLPTPDFSMPYNVICLSSTMVAFFFGSMLKMLTKRYAPLKEGKPVLSQRPIPRLLRALGRWLKDQE